MGLEVVSHVPGIVAAMLFVSAPLVVSGAREAFASVDPKLERVARTPRAIRHGGRFAG